MPKQVFDAEEFLAIGARALHCRVMRKGDSVKLKLRTPSKLITYITDPQTAEALLKKVPCDVIEL